MADIRDTQFFDTVQEKKIDVSEVLALVYEALTKKGYNPVNQIVGYVMSGDPTYITSYNSARSLIMKVERDEIIEELLSVYIDTKFSKQCLLSYVGGVETFGQLDSNVSLSGWVDLWQVDLFVCTRFVLEEDENNGT